MKHFQINAFVPIFSMLALVSLLASCHRYFVPANHQYTKQQIDSTILPDAAYVKYYQPYKQQLDAEMGRVVGHTAVALTKPSNAPETRLGNFFADALLTEAKKHDPDADFSFGTKGGLRIELQKGDITVGNLFELMPFENEMVLLELSGKSVLQLAQFIATTGGQPVAGLRMKIDNGKATDITIAGKPLELSHTYKLITYDYLANGGDNSRGLNNPISCINLGQKVREALITYVSEQMQAGKSINTQLDGRIIRNQ